MQGNVVVDGLLSMRPQGPTVVHTVKFVGVDETKFVGGGMAPLASDVGLWVMGHGRLDVAGAPKTGWTRLASSVDAGSRTLSFAAAPVGWVVGDELLVTPTGPPATQDFATGFDVVRVSAVNGTTVEIDRPLPHGHPQVNGTWTAEVANLTRNVRIEGTPTGRSHVWIRSTRAQVVDYAAIRFVGPRQVGEEFTESVLGRYGLHFHESGDGSRGSEVIGTVVRDAGGHAFVPHMSHGITFRDTVSFDTFEEAYWWDLSPDTRTPGPETNDTLYDHTMAALVRTDPDFRGYRLAGYTLGQGSGNTVRDSVAVGVQGNKHAAGFSWPESRGESGHGVWTFTGGNIAHNNMANGIFTWQNDDLPHVVEDFAAYHNGETGITHGAYVNSYRYQGGHLYGNGSVALNLHAVDNGGQHLSFESMIFDGGGVSDYLVQSNNHTADGTGHPTVFRCGLFQGARLGAVWVSDSGNDANHDEPTALDFEQPAISVPADVVFTATAPPRNVVRLQSGAGAVQVTVAGRGPIPEFSPPRACAPPTWTIRHAPTPSAPPPPQSPGGVAGSAPLPVHTEH